MIDLYLQAADEAAMRTALRPLGLLAIGEDGVERWRASGRAPLFALEAEVPVESAAAVTAPDRTVISAAVLAPGYHLNLRTDDPALAAAVVATGLVLDPPPGTPQRLFG